MTALLPGRAGERPRILFWGLAAMLVPFSIALPGLTRRAILARQERLPENAVFQALGALARADDGEARRLTAAVLASRPDRTLAGPSPLRFGALPEAAYLPALFDLAERLSEHGLRKEARAVAVKAIRIHHLEARALEEPRPWLVLARELRGDALRYGPVAALLDALGVGRELPLPVPSLEARCPRASVIREGAASLSVRDFMPVETETYGLGVVVRRPPGEVDLQQAVAAEMRFVLSRRARRLYSSSLSR